MSIIIICCASNSHPKQLKAVFEHCFIVTVLLESISRSHDYVMILVRLGYSTKCNPFDPDIPGRAFSSDAMLVSASMHASISVCGIV